MLHCCHKFESLKYINKSINFDCSDKVQFSLFDRNTICQRVFNENEKRICDLQRLTQIDEHQQGYGKESSHFAEEVVNEPAERIAEQYSERNAAQHEAHHLAATGLRCEVFGNKAHTCHINQNIFTRVQQLPFNFLWPQKLIVTQGVCFLHRGIRLYK